MKTPSLRARVVAIGTGIVVVVLVLLDVILYANLRSRLYANLNEVLEDRAHIVRVEAANVSLSALPDRLTRLGIAITIQLPNGTVAIAGPASTKVDPQVSKEVALDGGVSATIYVRRSGVDVTLSRLVRLEIGGTLLATAMAGLLLWYASRLMLRPLRQMTASAQRTAAGEPGRRVGADRPSTEVGVLATAFDDMVESLEAAVAQARHAEQRAETLHHRSRQVIETARDAFIAVDQTGVVLDWNHRAEQVFGWSRADAVGHPIDARGVPAAELVGPAATDADQPHEVTARRQNGDLFAAELSVWQTSDGGLPVFNAFVADITLRRQGDEAIQRLAAIVDSAQEAVVSATLDSVISTWNAGAEELYGFTAAEAIGQSMSLIIPSTREAEFAECLAQIGRGQAVPRLETVRRCKNGTLVEVAITASPVYGPGGDVVAQSIIARDITEQRWMARTLDETLSSLRAALDEAQRAEARTRLFLDDAAHQLRAPIAGVRATAEALLRVDGREDRERLLAALVREVSRANLLVSRLLKLARIDHDPNVIPAPCDVRTVVGAEIERARAVGPDIAFTASNSLPTDTWLVDAMVLREVLGNLLENGNRHARSRVEVTLEAAGGLLSLRVADDGPGIRPDDAERVFERFVSLDGRGGSGLGLPIARSLARAHGGDLRYTGGAFVLELASGPVGEEHGKRHEHVQSLGSR